MDESDNSSGASEAHKFCEELQQTMARMALANIRLEEKMDDVISAGSPREAAEVLADRFLDRYSPKDRDGVLEDIGDRAGDSLREYVCKHSSPEKLLGHILERASIDLGSNGVISGIAKAAEKLANTKAVIEQLVKRELERQVRLAVEAAIDKSMLDAVAAEVAEDLKGALPFDTKDEMKKYYQKWRKKHGWCDMGEAVRIAVYQALVDIIKYAGEAEPE